jgi:tetratricopeptide (TPR) repeat protein
MLPLRRTAVLLTLLALPAVARAGLYYSGERLAELPAQWRGFLVDQRTLRSIAVRPAAGRPASPARQRYLDTAERLEKAARGRKLTPDEKADLGALYVRLGEADKAMALLREAQRAHPNHFFIAANLGTAWQVQGDLQQAAVYLQQAVRLAPGKLQRAEEYHLKLVTRRLREPAGTVGLDDLFGVHYGGPGEAYEPGKLPAAERKKLPAYAAAVTQQLALWLPADPRLLWQLAELANAYGDVKTAAAMMDGCVTQFGLQARELRRHRQLTRAAADRLPKATPPDPNAHQQHAGGLAFRSHRPLLTKFEDSALPPISASGVNTLPWALLAETKLDEEHHPTFPRYLRELVGKQVSLTGFMQPLGDGEDLSGFLLIEYPVGCWYCEMPELTGMVYVEMPPGRQATYSRDLLRVVGRLSLNANDPEDFLFTIHQAKVAGAD